MDRKLFTELVGQLITQILYFTATGHEKMVADFNSMLQKTNLIAKIDYRPNIYKINEDFYFADEITDNNLIDISTFLLNNAGKNKNCSIVNLNNIFRKYDKKVRIINHNHEGYSGDPEIVLIK
jgi:hypothetical protein